VKVRLDLKCPMPDGVKLSTDVYLPDGGGPWPVVFIRTPYSNNDLARRAGLL